MLEKISKFNCLKNLNIFYEYSSNEVFQFFIEKVFEIVIICIQHHYLTDKAKLDFFKNNPKKIAKDLTNYRNKNTIHLDLIEEFLY